MENWRDKSLYFAREGNSYLFYLKPGGNQGENGARKESARFLGLVESKALEVQQNLVEDVNVIII